MTAPLPQPGPATAATAAPATAAGSAADADADGGLAVTAASTRGTAELSAPEIGLLRLSCAAAPQTQNRQPRLEAPQRLTPKIGNPASTRHSVSHFKQGPTDP